MGFRLGLGSCMQMRVAESTVDESGAEVAASWRAIGSRAE
jgi:hypothetical protein